MSLSVVGCTSSDRSSSGAVHRTAPGYIAVAARYVEPVCSSPSMLDSPKSAMHAVMSSRISTLDFGTNEFVV
jgi:hypothetical protein